MVSGSEFETVEKAAWIVDSLTATPIPAIEIGAPPPLDPRVLLRAHGEVYVDAIRTGVPSELAEAQGFPWNEWLFSAACASTAGVLAAMRSARADGVSGSPSSGLHHARRNTGAGFCTFNGLALAALTALDEGAREVLVLDLDAHCGGGTWSIVAHEPRVHHADVAVNDYDAWEPDGHGTLTLVDDAGSYLEHVDAALRSLDARRGDFDLCLYNAGVDLCTGESDDGSDRVITAEAVAERERRVFRWCREAGLPVAFVLAGGYHGGTIGRADLVALRRSTLAAAAGS